MLLSLHLVQIRNISTLGHITQNWTVEALEQNFFEPDVDHNISIRALKYYLQYTVTVFINNVMVIDWWIKLVNLEVAVLLKHREWLIDR